MRLKVNRAVAFALSAVVLGSCTSGDSSPQSETSDSNEAEAGQPEVSKYWGADYEVTSIEPTINGFDPQNMQVLWRLGRPGSDRTMLVDSGCNEITGFDFLGDDLSLIEAQLDQTLKECIEPLASIETAFKAILRGPSELMPISDEQFSITSDTTTVTLRRR